MCQNNMINVYLITVRISMHIVFILFLNAMESWAASACKDKKIIRRRNE